MSKKRKAPPRAAKKDPYGIDELLTSSKSRLIDVDLHGKLAAFFSDSSNWAQVSDSDKDFIHTLLPPHVELNDDGSIPTSFWKYNPEFRLDCRNLQEDLRAGRMDPEWQRQAAQAMEERAAGEFDDFKEREFEQYWGQKQKVEWNVLAGHASKVRLEELLREGLFHVGDVWRFDHTWGRGKDAIRVEKDCKIVEIDGKSITLAIPPGQLKFARRLEQTLPAATDEIMTPHEPEVTKSETPNRESSGMGKAPMADDESEVRNQSVSLPKVNGAVESDMSFGKGAKNHTDVEAGEEQATTEGVMESRNGTTKVDPEPHGSLDGPMLQLRRYSSAMSSELSDPPPRSENVTTPTKATANNQSDALSAATEYDIILCTTTGLLDLEKKILSIDGRTKPGSRTGSAWRDIRCLRNEQDMGSLFEMRDEYYAYKIAKGDYRCERFSR